MCEPKERPILFSTDMVQAILDGKKTQTRRVITSHTSELDWGKKLTWKILDWTSTIIDPGPSVGGYPDMFLKVYEATKDRLMHRIYPRIQKGDLLYVRETWAKAMATAYRQSPGVVFTPDPDDPSVGAVYKAGWTRSKPGPWKPSIHMPKKFARIWLEVKDVRVERVQEISLRDIKAEGIGALPWFIEAVNNLADFGVKEKAMPEWIFEELWDTINKSRGYSWESNPWVWVVEFDQVDKNQLLEKE